jgi:molecular chaperone HscB
MNHFELFGLPIAFRLDEAELRRRYLTLSRETHPDFHTLSNPDLQSASLDRNTLITNAYGLLKDPDKRMKYILMLQGVLEEDEKFQLPPAFLMEMMDLNEAIDQLTQDAASYEREQLVARVDDLESDLRAQAEPAITDFDAGNHQATVLAVIKTYYMQRRYLLRLRQQLAGMV